MYLFLSKYTFTYYHIVESHKQNNIILAIIVVFIAYIICMYIYRAKLGLAKIVIKELNYK